MKKVALTLMVVLSPLVFMAQSSVQSIEKYIPSLQYDNDFMTYLEVTMKDGFNTVKKAVGKMKFVQGEKVYAIEQIRYNPDKKLIIEKITYFYHKDTPIAISIEKKNTVTVFYLDNNKVIGSKKFTANTYKPFGGKKTLNLKNIPLDEKTQTPKKKYMEQAASLLGNMKEAGVKVLGYRF